MRDLVFSFLTGVLGTDGAQALRKASTKEPALEPLLVPRAALAWLESRHDYEGQIPGVPNSYLRFQKSETGYSGSVSLPESEYAFQDVDALHLASALGVATGVDLGHRKPIRDQALVRLGKSIDALVKAQDLFKSTLRSPSALFQPRPPPSGYKLKEEHADTGLKVHAFDGAGNHVGTAWFRHKPQGLQPVTVGVEDEHQRKGLATAMYDHARSITGKSILPGAIQTDEGTAFRSTYKAELPGSSHKPTQQQAPEAPIQPQKQPAGAAKPKLPKLSTMKVEKSEAGKPCSACGGQQFKNDRFQGCLCFRDLSKSIRTTAYSDGYVLEFGSGIDRLAQLALRKALQGDD